MLQEFQSYRDFVINNLDIYLPNNVIAGFSAIVGTVGNLLVIGSILTTKKLHTKTNVIILCLGLSDFFISVFIDMFDAVGSIAGAPFFEPIKKFCTFLAAMCMVNCVACSMGTALLAFNRYLFVLYPHAYIRVFTWPKTIMFCISTWFFGIIYYIPIYFDSNFSVFDKKTLSCIWNRKVNRVYTLVAMSIQVLMPAFSIVFFYSRILQKKIKSDKIVLKYNEFSNKTPNSTPRSSDVERSHRTARTIRGLIASCTFFCVCHIPYTLVLIIDPDDKLPIKYYMYTLTILHLNSAFTCLMYALTNTQLRRGYINFLNFIFLRKSYSFTLDV